MTIFQMHKARGAGERARLEAMLSRQSRRIRDAVRTFLADSRSEYAMREIRALLESGRTEQALRVIDQQVVRLGNVIPRAFSDVAGTETDVLARRMSRDARIAIGFDPTHERAAAVMRESKLRFIREFSAEQRAVTREALTEAFRNGYGPRKAARMFRDSIGLTRTQRAAVNNYRRLLETGSSEALSRGLRDRRFDSTIQNTIDEDGLLTSNQIERMVDRYYERMLTMRAETIARTESLKVVSEARQEALEQVMEDVGIDDEMVERTWMSTQDNRTRDSHAEMDGQTVIGMETPFESPSGEYLLYPGDPSASAEEIVNCRCTVGIQILTREEAAAA